MDPLQQDHHHHHPINEHNTRNIILGKYEVGRLLGQGTFAKVYYAKNLKTNESVAIKLINKDHLKKQSMIDQIQREISIMRLVRHPNIIELKEVMATKKKIFFVMEYVKGGELFAKLGRGKLKEDVARKYFRQLISAVDFCHSRGVFHRDLKPENLLLNENDDLKVSDFGLSALPEQLRNDGLLHTRCGTPAYVAPEVVRKKGYGGAKADIWSCGVILYALLAGFLPFRDENVIIMYRKVFSGDFQFPPWFSYETKKLISKILVVNPEKRASIQEIMNFPWFSRRFTKPIAFSIQENVQESNFLDDDDDDEDENPSPPSYNAFELISSMSSGFDLSGLFESGRKPGRSLFASKCSCSTIVKKLVSIAPKLNFRAMLTKDYKVKMEGVTEGRKGKLSVTAEVFKVAREVAVVEFSKSAGDTFEYRKLCEEDLRPALKDIVWTWQGECNDKE